MYPAALRALLTAAVLLPVPAAAQSWSSITPIPSGPRIDPNSLARDTGAIRDSIRAGRRSGQLTRRVASVLRGKAAGIDARADIHARDGLSDSERAFLQSNAEALRGQVDAARLQGKR
ncbi:hypothetical protein ACU5AX_12730 [Sphingomonas sp. XXL09]|uniref:hypothetical protein n=1 Tax=Sphingomonas sp. XXL09 TaxID=3457787 RepID=UPI00406B9F49